MPPDSPKLPPSIVRLTEPDEARFALLTPLCRGTSIVATLVIVPSLAPTVSDCSKLRPPALLVRHRMQVSDPQLVCSHMLTPDLAPPE